MKYQPKVRDAIYTALSTKPMFVKDLANKIGYSYGYVSEQIMFIRRDLNLNWTIAFVGHGGFSPVSIIERGKSIDTTEEETLKVGHDSWVRTTQNKCASEYHHSDIAMNVVMSPTQKAMYERAKIYFEMGEELIQKIKSA